MVYRTQEIFYNYLESRWVWKKLQNPEFGKELRMDWDKSEVYTIKLQRSLKLSMESCNDLV